MATNRRKMTDSDYHDIARKYGLEWLGKEESTKSKNRRSIWRCTRNHTWATRYQHIERGCGCPHCSGIAKKTRDDYIALAERKGFTWVEDVVINVFHKHTWICGNNHRFSSTYADINHGYGCAICAGNQRKTPDMYRKLGEETGYTWVGTEVKGVFDKTEWLCPKSHRFLAPYHMIDIGRGCPVCRESRYERLIADVLTAWGIPHEREKRFKECRHKGVLPFDFYIPSLNVLIEFQGPHHTRAQEQWGGQEALSHQQEKDNIKRDFAKANGMHLIEIEYTTEDIPGYLAKRISKATGIPRSTIMGDSKLKSNRSKIKGVIQIPLIKNIIEYTTV